MRARADGRQVRRRAAHAAAPRPETVLLKTAFALLAAGTLACAAASGTLGTFALGAGSVLAGPVQALGAAVRMAQPVQGADTAPGSALPAIRFGAQDVQSWAGGMPSASLPEAAAPAGAAADSVPLSGEAAPAGAGMVIEKTFGQGSGDGYVACGTGSIRNKTQTDPALIAEAAAAGLPFTVEKDSAEPQVLILHTHATETYRTHTGLWFDPADTARSTDDAVNMCAVGEVMAKTLNDAGICTLHDTTLNDYPSYTGSYDNSRAAAQRYLAQYPSIKVILDVHRDAMESGGARLAPVCTVGGRQAAQVMIVCGCGNGGSIPLPNCLQNLRFAAAWERSMEGMYSGLTRPVLYSYRYYNQDLSAGALLIEVGGHGNTLNEALYAGRLAAEGLAAVLLES